MPPKYPGTPARLDDAFVNRKSITLPADTGAHCIWRFFIAFSLQPGSFQYDGQELPCLGIVGILAEHLTET
jgi:hypothetical protein